jgi:Arc/MetJ family transcription regulator
MKRTSLELDAAVLNTAREILGTKTYSETVNKALAEIVRQHGVRSIV